jgi:hypothetical protein
MQNGCCFYKSSFFSLSHQLDSLNKVADTLSRWVAILNTIYTQVTMFDSFKRVYSHDYDLERFMLS